MKYIIRMKQDLTNRWTTRLNTIKKKLNEEDEAAVIYKEGSREEKLELLSYLKGETVMVGKELFKIKE